MRSEITVRRKQDGLLSGIRLRRFREGLRQSWRRLTEEDMEATGFNLGELACVIEQRHGVSRDIALRHLHDMQQIYLTR